MTVFVGSSNIKGPERPMNPVFPKLPRNYAADTARSRFFFPKKAEIGIPGGSGEPWNIRGAGNAHV
jgi:hypothetical protein